MHTWSESRRNLSLMARGRRGVSKQRGPGGGGGIVHGELNGEGELLFAQQYNVCMELPFIDSLQYYVLRGRNEGHKGCACPEMLSNLPRVTQPRHGRVYLLSNLCQSHPKEALSSHTVLCAADFSGLSLPDCGFSGGGDHSPLSLEWPFSQYFAKCPTAPMGF